MIAGREAETKSATEEEEAENDPVVSVCVWIVAFSIRVVEYREAYHPRGSQQMAIYIARLVVDVEAASERINV